MIEIKNTTDVSMDASTINLYRYKIVFVGDVATGKTSIINRLMDNKFSESYDVIKNSFKNF
jgi:GTPase SAR1 family protein